MNNSKIGELVCLLFCLTENGIQKEGEKKVRRLATITFLFFLKVEIRGGKHMSGWKATRILSLQNIKIKLQGFFLYEKKDNFFYIHWFSFSLSNIEIIS